VSVKRIEDAGQTLHTPTGKVLGVVDTWAAFDDLVEALSSAGFDEIEEMDGTDGIHLLERIHTFFFSDMESRILEWHLNELRQGHIIIMIPTPSDRIDEVQEIASHYGAHQLVHYGYLTITWLTK
jgi:hypothetical protein